MTLAFGQSYAGVYDAIYGDKNYAGEVDLIEQILGRYGRGGPRKVLDLGCGTGSHAIPLAQRGHAVTGIDRSPGMLAHATEKLKAISFPAGVPAPVFLEGDLRSLDLGQRFEVVLMMFAVLGYQHENADLLAALGTVRRHLEPGGLFIFDVWNGLAVLTDRPGRRVREVKVGANRIVRTTDADLDLVRHRCRIHFRVQHTDVNGGSAGFDEEHVVRFFFPQELDLALRCCALRLVALRGFPNYEEQPDAGSWSIIGVGQAQ